MNNSLVDLVRCFERAILPFVDHPILCSSIGHSVGVMSYTEQVGLLEAPKDTSFRLQSRSHFLVKVPELNVFRSNCNKLGITCKVPIDHEYLIWPCLYLDDELRFLPVVAIQIMIVRKVSTGNQI
jgi:hypothetical protein